MRTLILLLLLCLGWSARAQQTYTAHFEQSLLKEAVQQLERISAYKFYYDDKWFDQQPLVNGDFKAEKMETILLALFEQSTINFFVTDNKIILTQNSRIYAQLPDGYFLAAPMRNETADKPVFFEQFDTISANGKQRAALTLIGKEQDGVTRNLYTLSGQIRNAKSGETLPNIALRVKGKNISTVSDSNGNFSLQLPAGMNQIETESISHQPYLRSIMVYSNGKLDLVLKDRINQLAEVTVRGKKSQQVRTAITGVTTIEAENIKNLPLLLGERDILRVALSLPGIKSAGEGAAGFNVRGGKEDQNLFLLDDAPLYNPSHFFGFFGAINPYTTKKVDIYKGSIPAAFGGRLSSVFDISSKSGITDHFNGEAGLGPVTSSVSLGVPVIKDKAGFLVGGRATYSDWILKQLDDEQLKNSQASFYDLLVKYSHKINKYNTVDVMGYYSKDHFSISSDSLYKYSNRLLSLNWKHDFNDKHKGALVLTNSQYNFNIDYRPEGDNGFDFGYRINDCQMQLKFEYAASKKHKLSYGLMGKYYGIDPGQLVPKSDLSILLPAQVASEQALETAAYISDSYKISDKLLIDLGLRYSWYAALGASNQRIYQDGVPRNEATLIDTRTYQNNEIMKSYSGFEPRVAARYFLADDFSIKAGFDQTYQYIHQLSNNTTQSPTDTWKLSDNNVKPQKAQQFSMGLYRNLDNDKYEVSLEGYYKKSMDLLDYKVASSLALNKTIETELLAGEGKSYGVEFLIRKTAGSLNGWIAYTYSRAMIKLDSPFSEERVNSGKFFAANYDKPHDVSVALNYKITQRYSFSSNWVYQTGRPITYPIGKYNYGNANYVLYSDRNAFRVPDYYRLDLGLNIEGNHKIKKLAHSFWNISVYNVLGRNNPYSIFFVTKEGQVKAYKTSIFAVPIPTLTYNFKF